MEEVPRYLISGMLLSAADSSLQEHLAAAYEAAHVPRCMCTDTGVEMYIAKYGDYLIKRRPETGSAHAPSCLSYEPPAAESGLGEVLGDAVVRRDDERLTVRVDFPMSRRAAGGGVVQGEHAGPVQISTPRRGLGLKGVLHLLWEQAGFNRWHPHMLGKRPWAVVRTHLLAAARRMEVKGTTLADRLFIPEAFRRDAIGDIERRRNAVLSTLVPRASDASATMMVVVGELKALTETDIDYRITLKHMADCPLYMEKQTAERLKKAFESVYATWVHQQAALREQSGELGGVRLVLAGLVYAKREGEFHVDTVTLMLLTRNWIPLDDAFEMPLANALTAQQRHFLKPLRYESRLGAAFPNFVLLDTGPSATPLDVLSPFQSAQDRRVKEHAVQRRSVKPWVWSTDQSIVPPALPARIGP